MTTDAKGVKAQNRLFDVKGSTNMDEKAKIDICCNEDILKRFHIFPFE